MSGEKLEGPRFVLDQADARYPSSLLELDNPPRTLYVIGDPRAFVPGLAVIGARKATAYGKGCARRFAGIAAAKGVTVISGGARGCDAEAHRAALDEGAKTVVFLGGGCDRLYPKENKRLFQAVIDAGGAVASEHSWECSPRPYMFRERNRLIAGLAEAVLIVEAGLPSGTFSTADDALSLGKEVLAVPGSITSAASRGSNRLIYQGAIPIVDDESFEDALFATMGMLKQQIADDGLAEELDEPLVASLLASPMDDEELYAAAFDLYGDKARSKMSEVIAEAEMRGLITRRPDGVWSPCVPGR